jgi:hypothetical protein
LLTNSFIKLIFNNYYLYLSLKHLIISSSINTGCPCFAINTLPSVVRFAVVGLSLNSCSLGHSASDDLKSSNPAIALQTQKVVVLQQRVDAQEKAYKDVKQEVKDREKAVDNQKELADVEKKKLAGLKDQLDGAKQNLKGVKTQAKVQ